MTAADPRRPALDTSIEPARLYRADEIAAEQATAPEAEGGEV